MHEKLLYLTGNCPCCGKEIKGLISAGTSHFPCPICKGIVPIVFVNTSGHCPDVSNTKRLDQSDDD